MKLIMKLLIILFIAAVFVSTAAAEENVFNQYDDALGGFYGEIGGSGLSYQHWFDKLGVQTAFGLWYTEDDLYGGENYYIQDAYSPQSVEYIPFTYNIGVEAMYRLYSDSFQDWFDGCLYVFGGIMHTGNLVTTYNYEQTPTLVNDIKTYPYTGKTGPEYIPLASLGIGIGFEFVLFKHFSIPVEFGLSGKLDLKALAIVDAGFKPQIGLRYRF